jgi:hypothetical protein
MTERRYRKPAVFSLLQTVWTDILTLYLPCVYPAIPVANLFLIFTPVSITLFSNSDKFHAESVYVSKYRF